ncbi:NAD(P)-binding protein [Aspergillus pseudoustus]|uniref:NAD(P)-binding protein n=1 Tax=Aspergillus pseudoustus TaxID=1810923 RepID=A0ABR4JJ40_9EURO
MSKHAVLRLPSQGSWDNLVEAKEPRPSAGKHEVLIKVRSVALNFRDIAIATGKYPFPVKENLVPGSDLAGDIVQLGESVSGLQEGDKVVVAFDPTTTYGPIKSWANALGGPVDGVLSEYVVAPESGVVKVPNESTLSYAQWASVVCTGTTVWNALYGINRLMPGHTVLFQGTGGVSITGLALAKAAGAQTIITSSSDEKLQHVKAKYGVDHTINYKKTPDWAAEVQKITNGQGVDFILENGGSGTIRQSLNAIAFGGCISVIGFLSSASQEEMPDVAGLALAKGAVVRGIIIGSKQQLEEAVRFIGVRNLPMPIDKTFTFCRDQVIDAMKYLVSGQHIGKVCITF